MKRNLIIAIIVLGVLAFIGLDIKQNEANAEVYDSRFELKRVGNEDNLIVYIVIDKKSGEEYLISRSLGIAGGVHTIHLEKK